MKLDPDCIRDILLVVEEKSGYGNSITSTEAFTFSIHL